MVTDPSSYIYTYISDYFDFNNFGVTSCEPLYYYYLTLGGLCRKLSNLVISGVSKYVAPIFSPLRPSMPCYQERKPRQRDSPASLPDSTKTGHCQSSPSRPAFYPKLFGYKRLALQGNRAWLTAMTSRKEDWALLHHKLVFKQGRLNNNPSKDLRGWGHIYRTVI